MKEKNTSAKVLVACLIDGKPVNPGDVVKVDADTFRNLVLKKKLAPNAEASIEDAAPAPVKPAKPAKKQSD